MKRLTTTLLMLALFSAVSCTSYRAYQTAQDKESLHDWDGAIEEYSKALEIDPDNMKYKMNLVRAKTESSRTHFEKGKSLRAAALAEPAQSENRLTLNRLAAVEFELTVRLDPTNQYAAVEFAKAVAEIRNAIAVDRQSLEQLKKKAITKAQPPTLDPASNEPLSLNFPKPTPVKDIYRALGNAFGINVLFDQSVKDEDRVSIELRDVTAEQALERVMQAANHFYKVLDPKSIIVVADNPQNRKDYEDLVIQTFYLSNGDAEQVSNVVRTMIEARNVFPLKALNAITIRDTADKVRIAEKIIEANDKARSEVVVEVELLEMDATKGRELGMQLANTSGSLAAIGSDGKPITSITTDQLGNLGALSWSMNVPSILYSFIKNNSDAQLLANPTLRISEGEKATLHIGDRIPVPVSTFTSATTGGGSTYAPVTSFQYQDIGIKISIEPRVHHNREVTLKLTVEVSALNGYEPSTTPPQPIIGTRTIDSTIRLKDGETNFLAGLIQKTENKSVKGTPFLSDIPILGRLFGLETTSTKSTDVVLTMTPHIIRIPDITEDDVAPLWVGTSNNLTFRGVSPRLESQSNVDPFSSYGRPQPAAAEQSSPRRPAQPSTAPGLAPGAPSDPFHPSPPANQVPQQTPPNTDGELRVNNPVDQAANSLPPRVAPQPENLALKAGEQKQWSVVGMDLTGLKTPKIVFHYDPAVVDIDEVTFGPALKIDPTQPLLARIDPSTGTITVASMDGAPLSFESGGEIASLRVRAIRDESTVLLIEPLQLKNDGGSAVDALVTGGRTQNQ